MRSGEQVVIGCIVIERVVNRYKVMYDSPTLGLHIMAFTDFLEDAIAMAEEWN